MKLFALNVQVGGVSHQIARLSAESHEWAVRRVAEKLLMFCDDGDTWLQEVDTPGKHDGGSSDARAARTVVAKTMPINP